MKRAIQSAVVCVAVLVAGQVRGNVIITYLDVGADLQFDISGSLSGVTVGGTNIIYATASEQALGSPVFYNSPSDFSFVGIDFTVAHTAGPFATNLPAFNAIDGTSSGTGFLFRLTGGDPGPASSLELWGDWGAANAPINGQMILTNQSAAGIGMVNGWTVQTIWGDIAF